MRPVLDIHPECAVGDAGVTYRFDLHASDTGERFSLFYEVSGDPAPEPVGVHDGALCAVIIHAMGQRRLGRGRDPGARTLWLAQQPGALSGTDISVGVGSRALCP